MALGATRMIAAQRNRELQWMRAAAALCVVVYHAGVYLERFTGDARFSALFDGRLGFLGVAIFFALSGYLMAEILPRTDAATFLLHRVVRIYPVFLLVFATLYVARRKWDDYDLLALSLVPVGSGRTYYLGVEWTLLFEVTFYVFLYLVALAGLQRRLSLIALIWIGVAAMGSWAFPAVQTVLTPTIDLVPLMAVNAAFAGGLLIPTLRERAVFTPFLGLVAVLICFWFGTGGFIGDRWIAAVAAVILVGLCVSLRTDATMARPISLRALDRYGDWSYALYLCHVPLIIGIMIGDPPIPSLLLWVSGILLPLVVAIPFGIADVWFYRHAKRWADSLGSRRRKTLAAGYIMLFIGVAVYATVFGFHPAASAIPTTIATDNLPKATLSIPLRPEAVR
ncbi:acyltransferase family protein [Aureimonas jatrophae]|uniref:Peptidoglycan/LPS O-acetylase OafA/YrhL, contains acyltransferase and SGNH-hydrolase domains n=2 Tax=Aureimonas jatrophae TaxID=1166073 RepID=A0A1H0NFV6_9HYPH|nr:acyltransferase [Aureimonas jatrophae]MBB3953055.1 peptidoglycan/LPS O-acetylase OafA/YrhL [Aureimonas jatrophae]SDO91275.1 Peptidoglycan/LPS O-acetylase OafA/YrhL, contains acyltransferase and SGNH-hydrolase domains [Aureimonas jatrophae]